MLVERRSEGDDGSEEEDADNLPEDVERMCGVEPECTLETKVRDLMEVTFNEANMRTTMAQLNYNANKRPLEHHQARLRACEAAAKELTNMYYSVIPHDFGWRMAPIIGNEGILQHKIQLLESLSGMKIAEELMKTSQIASFKAFTIRI